MPLTGPAKVKYQREYMRKKRAEARKAKPKKAVVPAAKLIAAQKEIERLKASLKAAKTKA